MTRIYEKSQQGLVSNPNVLINTCLTVNQRAGATYNSTGFGYDRLWLETGTAGILSRIENNYTDDPFKAPYYAKANITTAAAIAGLAFTSEDSRRFRGNPTMTFSFWYRLTGKDIVVEQFHANGGVSSWENKGIVANVPQVSVWTKFSVTFDVATWSQSYSSDDIFLLGVRQAESDSTTTPFTLDIADVKLEFGAVATPWVMEDPHINLSRCQRFYYVPTVQRHPFPCYASGYAALNFGSFPVTMRKAPTVEYFDVHIPYSSPTSGWAEIPNRTIATPDMLTAIVRNTNVATDTNAYVGIKYRVSAELL